MPRHRYRQDPLPLGPDAPPVELYGPEQPNPPSLQMMDQGQLGAVPRSSGVLKAGGSLCYHHGGSSIQELLIPLLSFRCAPPAGAEGSTDGAATGSKGKARRQKPWPGTLVEKVTNRILMVPIELPVDLLNLGQDRQTVLAAYDCKTEDLVATPIQAIGAELDRDTNLLTLTPGQAAATPPPTWCCTRVRIFRWI